MPERLSPFEALAGDVRPLVRVDPESVFPELRRRRQAKERSGSPLHHLHTDERLALKVLHKQVLAKLAANGGTVPATLLA